MCYLSSPVSKSFLQLYIKILKLSRVVLSIPFVGVGFSMPAVMQQHCFRLFILIYQSNVVLPGSSLPYTKSKRALI